MIIIFFILFLSDITGLSQLNNVVHQYILYELLYKPSLNNSAKFIVSISYIQSPALIFGVIIPFCRFCSSAFFIGSSNWETFSGFRKSTFSSLWKYIVFFPMSICRVNSLEDYRVWFVKFVTLPVGSIPV